MSTLLRFSSPFLNQHRSSIRSYAWTHTWVSVALFRRNGGAFLPDSLSKTPLCSGNNAIEGAHIGDSKERLLQKLQRYGVAGVLSYGLLNTVYYLTTFLLVWFYFAPAAGKMGYAAAVERFLKVMAMVWAGSQVTKIIRAGGALALAPFVDRGLSWFTVKFNFKSKGKAFAAIAGVCFSMAVLLFVGLTLLSA